MTRNTSDLSVSSTEPLTSEVSGELFFMKEM